MRIKMIRILHRYNINRTRSRDENKCNECEICFSAIMVICNKQDLSSTEVDLKKKDIAYNMNQIARFLNLTISPESIDETDKKN